MAFLNQRQPGNKHDEGGAQRLDGVRIIYVPDEFAGCEKSLVNDWNKK